ncbi:aldo/keto reductase [Pseudoxanthomonas sacheonensis]|uniref:Oxidoreductase n=1 Tax=Pseudoxanthomonas sacheonensis TaxID=443615 RepID=A0ABU1RU62_9GAMM|nr:aldo/keto reductase [Pseudoxanthomonas sacheonensis]MDR6842301.1 putative oxidoreductase [Pseudoxanthomonas sacheonensis]
MQTCRIPHSDLKVSRIAYGCMHLSRAWDDEPVTASEISATFKIVEAALEQGITLFDHADIYARGKSELLFGEVLRQRPDLRGRIVLQSKCGIRVADDPHPGVPARYDFSREHLLRSVEGILRRLGTEYLDILLLHRPDPLAEPAEVASAFEELQRSGKVRHFGVSNHSASQISLLRKYVDRPLVINQIELSLAHHYPISETILSNQSGVPYAGATGTLDYCREHDILVQAWSPLAGGRLAGPAAALAAQLAQAKGVTTEAVLLAWLLKHPAPVQPIVGTTRPDRLADSCRADTIGLTREEWYSLLAAVRGHSVP